jgi:PPOX class probable F420-dependent enzyme
MPVRVRHGPNIPGAARDGRLRCGHGTEVEARIREQEAGPVAEGEAGGEAPEAVRAARAAQELERHVTADAAWARDRLAEARIARLGTVGPDGTVRLVPVCCALAPDADELVGAVDHKPKSTTALARLADIERTGQATVLVDHYEEDWSALWWVRAAGAAAVVPPGDPRADRARDVLVAKYAQYRDSPPAGPVYTVALDRLTWWRADRRGGGGSP